MLLNKGTALSQTDRMANIFPMNCLKSYNLKNYCNNILSRYYY